MSDSVFHFLGLVRALLCLLVFLQRSDQYALAYGGPGALAFDRQEILLQDLFELQHPVIVGALRGHFLQDHLANYEVILVQDPGQGQELGSEGGLELQEFLVPLIILEIRLGRALRLVFWLLVLIDQADQEHRQQEQF